MRRRASGVSVMVIVVMLLLMMSFLAVYTLSRHSGGLDQRTETIARMTAAQDALEAFAASAGRLPCPANPATDTGEEVQLTASTCTHPEGTLPWKTIGLRREQGYDQWDTKLSYRVYINGGDGSLTQPAGVDMTHCDLVEPDSVLGAGRVCRTSTDPYQRNTSSASFLANKGLRLIDMGVDASTRAYVIVSHGPTGLGGYTMAGAKRADPIGDQRDNMRATGPFTIKAFSDPDTATNNANHFDDLLVYRNLAEVVKRANLAARDWPEGATFNAATLASATGSGAYRADVGNDFTFMDNRYEATGGTGSFSFTTSAGTEGIGITSADSFLVTGAFVNVGEVIRVELSGDATRAAITLNHFGKLFDSTLVREQVRVRFLDSSDAPVGVALLRQGCRADGGLATLVVEPSTPGAQFRNVELRGENVSGFGISSSWLLAEFAACTSATCDTTLGAATNRCLRPSVATAFSPASITRPASAALTYTIANGTDNPAFDGLAFTVALPAGLVMADTAVTNSCGATVSTPPAGSGGDLTISGAALANNTASCTIAVNVTASNAGTYSHAASAITASANLINGISASSPPALQVQ